MALRSGQGRYLRPEATVNLGIVPWIGLAQAIYLLCIAFLAGVAVTTLAWMLYAWRTPDAAGHRLPHEA